MTQASNPLGCFFRRFVLAAVVGAAAVTGTARADSMSFRETNPAAVGGATGTGDVSIFRNISADYSHTALLYVGAYGGGAGDSQTRRTLLRFDVSALAGLYSQIDSITLNIYPNLYDDGTDGTNTTWTNTLEVYRVATANSAWVESDNVGTGAADGDSSWLFEVHPADAWAGSAGLSSPGTDYDAAALATVTTGAGTVTNTNVVVGGGPGTALGGGIALGGGPVALTALIDAWLTPGQNAGLLLKHADETTTGLIITRLNSAETANELLRPQLVVNYTPIPEPASLGLLLLGGTMLCRRRSTSGR